MDRPTLLILGAGASKPYNFPLGPELVAHTISALRKFQPQSGTHAAQSKMVAEQLKYQTDDLAERLFRSKTPTIDSFLSDSPEEAVIMAMTGTIWQRESEALTSTWEFPDDWIAWLYHRSLKKHPDNFRSNKFAIASFNYDRMPRAVMASMMANQYNIPLKTALTTVDSEVEEGIPRYFHIHGEIGVPLAVPPNGSGPDSRYFQSGYHPANLRAAASGIKTMYDQKHHESVKAQLNKYLDWADQILFVGIAYHPEMLRLIPDPRASPESLVPAQWLRSKSVFAGTAYALNERNLIRVQEWGSNKLALGGAQQSICSFLENHL